jgi:hypothetical protein
MGIKNLMLVLLLVASSFARTKMFPATHDSVPAENRRAEMLGLKRYETLEQVQQDVASLKLVPLTVPTSNKLPLNRRYALPETVAFVEKLDHDFYEMTEHRLVVDSAVRPRDVQKRLTRRNRNAAPADGARASSHERGTTVDLARPRKKGDLRWLLLRLAYYKARGDILVIEERACIHVFVGGSHELRLQDSQEVGWSVLEGQDQPQFQQGGQDVEFVEESRPAPLPCP